MKTSVQLLASVALFFCFHSAAGLQCLSCSDSPCSSPTSETCTSEMTHCLSQASYVFKSSLSLSYSYIDKSCVTSDRCPSTGIDQVSVNVGSINQFLDKQCCDTDNCNTANSSTPTPSAGSLQCYGCNPGLECTSNVSCLYGENCFQTSHGYQYPIYGCVSENQCNTTDSLFFSGSEPVTCCNTSHCNKPDVTLQCAKCTDESCSSQTSVTCSSSYCASNFYMDSFYNYTFKACAPPPFCTAAGSQLVSFLYGSISYYSNQTCCNTNDCNTPSLSAPPAGSLQCYSCGPGLYNCNSTVTCRAEEICFQTNISAADYNITTATIYGCASESLCSDHSLSQRYLGPSEPLSCCRTSLCNGSGSRQVLSPALLLSLLLLLLCSHG
ncbi:hypothetical protein WMY93_024695 [Mugilogobius chulae]|uniref:UPAR/Ly6 domain-containing protein n=1 Tax=Mugilogobius chulae TaxID=88201 RepID=A0AAW0N0A7_9GOBI